MATPCSTEIATINKNHERLALLLAKKMSVSRTRLEDL